MHVTLKAFLGELPAHNPSSQALSPLAPAREGRGKRESLGMRLPSHLYSISQGTPF